MSERDVVRDAFEEWAEADNRRLEPNEGEADDRTPSNNHYYEDDTTNQAYIGWCAAQPLVAEVERLRETLTKAAEQFEFYEREHHEKMRAAHFNGIEASANLSREKALANSQLAAMCRAGLPQEPSSLQPPKEGPT